MDACSVIILNITKCESLYRSEYLHCIGNIDYIGVECYAACCA